MTKPTIKEILDRAGVIAIVGLSTDQYKPSNVVARYLIGAGYRIIPVNPRHKEILGNRCYAALSDIPERFDIVDIFMGADKVLPVVEEAVTFRPLCIWLQLGIINDAAKETAERHGVPFVMDKCIKIEHSRLFGT